MKRRNDGEDHEAEIHETRIQGSIAREGMELLERAMEGGREEGGREGERERERAGTGAEGKDNW